MTVLINTEIRLLFAIKDIFMEEFNSMQHSAAGSFPPSECSNKKKIKKKAKFKIDIKNMGVNIDKNEYREIVLSNSNHPENFK